MKVTLEHLPASQIGFAIEVEGEKSQAIYDRTIQRLIKTSNIPGFRKGKAPKQLVLQQIGGMQLKAGVLEDLIEETLTQALKDHQEEVKAIGQFEMRSPMEEVVANFEIGKPLSFEAAIDVAPKAALKQYKQLSVQAEKVEPKLEVVEQTLKDFQVRRSTLVPVEDRPAQLGDEVTLDITVTDVETGVVMEDLAIEDDQFDLDETELGMGELVRGVVGMSLAETKDIPLSLPEELYKDDLVDKAVIFTATLKDIKVKELPALDDEFAQAISQKQTMVELREFLEQREIDQATDKTKANVEDALLQALIQELEVDIPQSMIAQEVNFLIQQQISYLSRTSEGAKMANQIFNRDNISEIRDLNQPEAILRVKRLLALEEVAKQEQITPTKEEISTRAEEVMESIEDPRSVDPEKLIGIVAIDLTNEKVLAWLAENATIEYVPEGSLAVSPEFDPLSELPESSGSAPLAELNPAEATLEATVAVEVGDVEAIASEIVSEVTTDVIPEAVVVDPAPQEESSQKPKKAKK